MKVIGVNGSPRKEGNTFILLRTVLGELEKQGIETEIIQIGGQYIRGCRACYTCRETKNRKCVISDDLVNESITKLIAADGLVLGSPTYFADITPEMKAFIDRVGVVCRANDSPLKYKAGAAVMSVRRGGATHAFDTMNHFLHNMQMFLVGGSYWNMVYGREIGEVKNDTEGMLNMQIIGENMAWLLKRIQANK